MRKKTIEPLRKKTSHFFLILSFLFLYGNSYASGNNDVAGTWVLNAPCSSSHQYQWHIDSTGNFNDNHGTGGRWTLDGDQVTLTYNDKYHSVYRGTVNSSLTYMRGTRSNDLTGTDPAVWCATSQTGSCTPTSITVSPSSISLTAFRGEQKSVNASITDNCGNAKSYEATSNVSWLSVSSPGTGILSIAIDTSTLQQGNYAGSVTISSPGSFYPAGVFSVDLTVIPNCTGLSISPSSVSEILTRGQSKAVQLTVNDSCGKPVDFNATSSQDWIGLIKQSGVLSWLSVSSPGTGILSIAINTSTLQQGNYAGSVTISSPGSFYPAGVFSVDLTVITPF